MEHPGVVLNQKLKECRMRQSELALRTGVSEKHISTVVNGQKPISVAFAQKLGYVFESTSFWLKLQADYDQEKLLRKEESAITSRELDALQPLQDFIEYFTERGYLKKDISNTEKVMQLRKIFRVSNLMAISEITHDFEYRFQLSSNVRIDPYIMFAWQRLCEMETGKVKVDRPFDIAMLYKKTHDIKQLVFTEQDELLEKLQSLFSSCGVAFQVVRSFRGAPARGFAKMTGNKKLLFCITVPHQRADTFWYILFHELAHILNSDLGYFRYVDFDSTHDKNEVRADEFAWNMLIPSDIYRRFVATTKQITWTDVERLAKEAEVIPCIALYKVQSDGLLDWTEYPEKAMKYSWL